MAPPARECTAPRRMTSSTQSRATTTVGRALAAGDDERLEIREEEWEREKGEMG